MERSYTHYSFRPEKPPQLIKNIIWATCILSILSALLSPLMAFGPQEILSLSWYGFNHDFFWQLITYLFVLPPYGGITMGFIVTLFFNMYVIWVVGGWLLNSLSKLTFCLLYFGSGVMAGLCCLAMMHLTGIQAIVAGSTPAMFALFMVWAMLFPDMELLFFFLFPVKSRWLVAGLIGLTLLMSSSQKDLIFFTLTIAGSLYGYLFGLLGLNLNGPFPFSHPFENAILRLKGKGKAAVDSSAKIVDINSGRPVGETEDEAFMDEMLGKISLRGKDSLTQSERDRMDKIAKKKKR